MAPRWPQVAPRWRSLAPRRPKMGQDSPNLPQDGPKWSKMGPNMDRTWPQNGPRWSKIAPRWPKVAPRWPNLAPRWPQDGPRWPQDDPTGPQGGHQMAPRWRKTVQESPKIALHGPNMDPRRLKKALRRENLHFPYVFSRFTCPGPVFRLAKFGKGEKNGAARRHARTPWEAVLMILNGCYIANTVPWGAGSTGASGASPAPQVSGFDCIGDAVAGFGHNFVTFST